MYRDDITADDNGHCNMAAGVIAAADTKPRRFGRNLLALTLFNRAGTATVPVD